MKTLAIIPARGGSKRIPYKNVKDFMGKPIIAYPIKAAIDSKLFDEVMVSTEDIRIARIAKEYGAKVPFMRSKKNSSDHAGLADVCIEVVKFYKSLKIGFDAVCCILPTAPFVSSEKIITAKKMIESKKYSCIFPVVEYNYPIQRSLKMDGRFVKMRWPGSYHKRSQDLEKTYHDAGQFYFIKTKTLLDKKKMFVRNSGVIILNDLEAQDIDTETDWKLAELKYRLRNFDDFKKRVL